MSSVNAIRRVAAAAADGSRRGARILPAPLCFATVLRRERLIVRRRMRNGRGRRRSSRRRRGSGGRRRGSGHALIDGSGLVVVGQVLIANSPDLGEGLRGGKV